MFLSFQHFIIGSSRVLPVLVLVVERADGSIHWIIFTRWIAQYNWTLMFCNRFPWVCNLFPWISFPGFQLVLLTNEHGRSNPKV